MTGPTIVLSLAILTTAVSIYFHLKTRHLERMAMIENGMEQMPKRPTKVIPTFGMFCMGIGTALILGHFIDLVIDISHTTVLPGLICLCAGASLLIARKLNF